VTLQILLVHGMGRTSLSMRRLGRALHRAGHDVQYAGYVVTIEGLDRMVDRLHAHMQRLADGGQPYLVVGHSLGGVLVRLALERSPALPRLPEHLIMLGPPNRPPRIARKLRRFWPYRLINGEVGQLLADGGFVAALPPPPIPCTIVAGTGGRRGRWSPFGDEPNDGLVAVSETRCSPEDQVIEIPARHTFMMNHPAARKAILEIIASITR
jgi:pimeloyl-ACP methyl ester carboxylesterase